MNLRRGGPVATGRGVTVPLADGSEFWPEAPGVQQLLPSQHRQRRDSVAKRFDHRPPLKRSLLGGQPSWFDDYGSGELSKSGSKAARWSNNSWAA